MAVDYSLQEINVIICFFNEALVLDFFFSDPKG